MKTFGSIIVVLGMLSACAVPSNLQVPTSHPTAPLTDLPEITGKVVTIYTTDGIKLSATIYENGSTAVILAHMGLDGVSQKSWQPFAEYITSLGYTALTLDFRGKGLSQGPFIPSNLKLDIDAAVQFMRDRGYKKIVCMGASMGGTACLRAVIDHQLDGLVVIASPFSIGTPTYTSPYEMEKLMIPTLFITATDDKYGNVIDMKVMFAKAPEPKKLVIYEGVNQHGTDLFFTQYGTEFRDLLTEYLSTIPN
jgi:dienelactone hydrolase